MSLIEWRKEFESGIAGVDHEHRELVKLLNQLLARLDHTDDPDELEPYLGEIYAQISAHFALEEKVMRDAAYDRYAEHKADHERLLDSMRDMMEELEDGTSVPDREAFAENLRLWFMEHFRVHDPRLHKIVRE